MESVFAVARQKLREKFEVDGSPSRDTSMDRSLATEPYTRQEREALETGRGGGGGMRGVNEALREELVKGPKERLTEAQP